MYVCVFPKCVPYISLVCFLIYSVNRRQVPITKLRLQIYFSDFMPFSVCSQIYHFQLRSIIFQVELRFESNFLMLGGVGCSFSQSSGRHKIGLHASQRTGSLSGYPVCSLHLRRCVSLSLFEAQHTCTQCFQKYNRGLDDLNLGSINQMCAYIHSLCNNSSACSHNLH